MREPSDYANQLATEILLNLGRPSNRDRFEKLQDEMLKESEDDTSKRLL